MGYKGIILPNWPLDDILSIKVGTELFITYRVIVEDL